VADRALSVNSPSFDPESLAAAVEGNLLHGGNVIIRGAAVDSRLVQPGNAFFALAGERTDGHRFVADAARRGAGAVVVSTAPAADELAELGRAGTATILVDDPLVALRRAAAAWRHRFTPLVIGVTGSLAKTSTKEQTAEVLAQRWTVLRNRANENNEIGLPLTLLRLSPADEVAVLEMGMYQPGDIRILAEVAQPSIGVVTAVRGAHLERAGSIDAIERGKRELVEALPRSGTAVLNGDDMRVARMADHVPDGVSVVRYGFAPGTDVRADDVESLGPDGMRFRLVTQTGTVSATIPALGRHSVHNALAAAAVGLVAGLTLDEICAGLARPFRVPHRSTLLAAGQWHILDDTYNAAPDSMIAALDLLASLPGRHVAVLGEMLELGADSDAGHRAVGAHAARSADVLVAVGRPALTYSEAAEAAGMSKARIATASDRDAAFATLTELLEPGDTILLKASRGAAFDVLVDELRAFAEAERVA
jgi:UDP-N-acetylmuramoyl-tripeptide--D-alanyl-D-alanine ligase